MQLDTKQNRPIQQATSWPFIRLYILAFIFFSANSILNVIMPIRIESIGGNNTMIGLIMGTYMLTCMFFRPWAGYLVNKYGPVKVLRVLLFINGLALLLYTISGIEGFFIARFMQGICTAFFSMTLQITIIDTLSDNERSQGVSLYSLSTYMPSIVGPLMAFGIWQWGGMNAFTVSMIVMVVITSWFGYRTSMTHVSQEKQEQVSNESSKSQRLLIRQIITHTPFVVCSLLMLITSVVFGAVTVFIPLYANQVEYGNAGIYLMIQASVIVLSRFLLRKYIPSDGNWNFRFIFVTLLLAALAALLLSLSEEQGPFFLYSAALLMGIAQALLYPTLLTYLTFVLPNSSRNLLLGLFVAFADLGISLGGVAMGPIADQLSYSAVYLICTGLIIVASILAIHYQIRLKIFQKN